jgi:hypothetical protein
VRIAVAASSETMNMVGSMVTHAMAGKRNRDCAYANP